MSRKTMEKMEIRTLIGVGKCGRGFHLKIPPKIARAYDLESGDTIRVHLMEVRHATIRED